MELTLIFVSRRRSLLQSTPHTNSLQLCLVSLNLTLSTQIRDERNSSCKVPAMQGYLGPSCVSKIIRDIYFTNCRILYFEVSIFSESLRISLVEGDQLLIIRNGECKCLLQ
ncbi:hypothetical protein PC128_g5725 [Phytophthora cactorum]|nr:hypothetical protein PC128_g5725 [Phytophthora cactorum]